MNLVALVHSDLHVCVRYRLLAFRDVLKSAGYSLILQELPRAALDRMRMYRTTGDVDAVILQRNLLSLPELFVLRLSAKRLIFDFDDAIWMRDSYNPRGFYSSKQDYRFRFLMRSVNAVVAGNGYLADKARQCSRRASVVTIPTCVNPMKYSLAAHDSPVWTSSSFVFCPSSSFILYKGGPVWPGTARWHCMPLWAWATLAAGTRTTTRLSWASW